MQLGGIKWTILNYSFEKWGVLYISLLSHSVFTITPIENESSLIFYSDFILTDSAGPTEWLVFKNLSLPTTRCLSPDI